MDMEMVDTYTHTTKVSNNFWRLLLALVRGCNKPKIYGQSIVNIKFGGDSILDGNLEIKNRLNGERNYEKFWYLLRSIH